MQARWVIAGTFVVLGAYGLAGALLVAFEVDLAWRLYVVSALGSLGAGMLMVAHAPLHPWREPAMAGVLAIAVLAVIAMAGPDSPSRWIVSRALHPWYVGIVVAALSGVMAAAGGLVVRRVSTATTRTDLIVLLSGLILLGIVSPVAMVMYGLRGLTLVMIAGVAVSGFITQAVIVPRRPWACGAGSVAMALFALASEGGNQSLAEAATTLAGGLLLVGIGYGGARLAWRLLRRGDEPSSLPPATLS